MNNLVLEQYTRLLDKLPPSEPWAALEESGFLNLLRPEEDGGADLSLNDLFPLALETGARSHAPVILETMVARLMNPDAIAIGDVERALSGHWAARPLAAAVAAGQMVGAFEEVLRMTVEYATTRRQFGREIGHFQAIKHHVAIMAEEVAASRMAAEAAFEGQPLEISERRAAIAKIRCGQAARVLCARAHAVHGAIGVSLEHPLHRYTRRLHTWSMSHGGEGSWSKILGDWALQTGDDFTTLSRLA